MGWKIVEATDVPFGRRALRFGNRGIDVRELQEYLAAAGFYFGPVDGIYGALTEEAVFLFQKTLNLRKDGIAGPEVITALEEISSRLNRIIYTVKPREDLQLISQKFGVTKSAWSGIPGQGDPQRKVYPGMKLLLYQKALFCSGKLMDQLPITAYLEPGWQIGDEGELIRVSGSAVAQGHYQVLKADAQTWKHFLVSRRNWQNLTGQLKKESGSNWGIDLRNAPLETIFLWKDFLNATRQALCLSQFRVLMLPLIAAEKRLLNRFYWLSLPQLSDLTELILVEPLYNLESPDSFLKSASHLRGSLRRLVGNNLGTKTLLMGQTGGWEWRLDQGNQCREIMFREGKLVAAMNHRSAKYSAETTFTVVGHYRGGEHYCSVFRDHQGWKDWIQMGIKFNLMGFAIHDLKDLGKSGRGLILGSFAVLPSNKL